MRFALVLYGVEVASYFLVVIPRGLIARAG